MPHTNLYFNEVIEAHQQIEQWLGQEGTASEVCSQLIARFSEHYSMIGVAGHFMDFNALAGFFRANGAVKKGMKIEVFDLRTVAKWPAGAVIFYQERQTLADGSTTLRYSTAVFDRTEQGKISWRHLHETATGS